MKPILFNTEMVRAILDGQKTVTRRAVKPQPKSRLSYVCMGYKHGSWSYPGADAWKYWGDESFRLPDGLTDEDKNRHWTPPCHTDDILYVRERVAYLFGRYVYRADYKEVTEESKPFFKPSIHMPREAARIFLRVKNVRVERLQDITAQGSLDEGVKLSLHGILNGESTTAPFGRVWDSTIKPIDRALYGWAANPWVFVVSFTKITKEEAENEQ